MASARLAPLLLLALLLCGLAASARAQDGEQPSDGIADAAADAAAADGAAKPRRQRPPFILRQQDSWVMEGCAVAVLLVFLVNVFIGRRRNERLALAWTSELVAPGGVIASNFSLLGPGDTQAGEVLLKDSAFCFKFWASGRRFCQGLMATFQLVRRQDLLAWSVQALRGQADVLEIEVRMNEGAMPPLVLAVAPPAIVRTMQLDCEDVKALCKKVEPTRDRIANWPERLTVLAEHSSIFYDLMTPQLLDVAFGKETFAQLRPYFRFLHVTSEATEGHKLVIRLSFSLPREGDTATFNAFLTLTCLLIDHLGCYRLSPEQQKRAADARAKKQAVERESQADEMKKRAEEWRQRKLEGEQERLRRLPPDQREKEIERKKKIQARRRIAKMGKNI